MENQHTHSHCQVTKDNVYVGMPVQYYKAPKAVPFLTQVISAPRTHKDELCVSVAMVGEPVPLSSLVTAGDTYGSMTLCGRCGATYQDTESMMNRLKFDRSNDIHWLCATCTDKELNKEQEATND